MTRLTQSTKSVKLGKITRNWHLIDIAGKILGRTVPGIARLLQGKHKRDYVPYLDSGDYVIVINASRVKITGKKIQQKEYTSYSGYPGGLRKITLGQLLIKDSRQVIIRAVSGMLPKNKFRDMRLKRLFVFKDEKHPYGDKISN